MRVVILFVLCSIAVAVRGQSDVQKKALLTGKWQFEKFVSPLPPSRQETDSLTHYNKLNKGLVFTFSSDGKASTFLPSAPARENFRGVFRYYPSRKNLVMERENGETMAFIVIQISDTWLQLGMKNSPWQMKLKRM